MICPWCDSKSKHFRRIRFGCVPCAHSWHDEINKISDTKILDHLLDNPKRESFILHNLRCKGKQAFDQIKYRQTGRTNRDVLNIVNLLSEGYNTNTLTLVRVANLREVRYHYEMIISICRVLGITQILGNTRCAETDNLKFIVGEENIKDKFAGRKYQVYNTHYYLEEKY